MRARIGFALLVVSAVAWGSFAACIEPHPVPADQTILVDEPDAN